MNCRPSIRPALILQRMRRWLAISRQPFLNRKYTASQVRRRYWYLVRKHREIAASANLTETTILETEFQG